MTSDPPNNPIWKWDVQTTANFIKSQSDPKLDPLRRNFLNGFVSVLKAQKQGLANAPPDKIDPYKILPVNIGKAVVGGKLPAGSIFVKIQIGGFINAISGVVGGVTEPYVTNLADCKRMWKVEPEVMKQLSEWYDYANLLKAKVLAKVGQDKIDEMPMQIIEMMVGKDMDMVEIQNLRSRVYTTVVMGMGTNASALLQDLEGTENDIVLAKPSGAGKVEQFHKCPQCNNVNQGDFILDKKNGDIICGNCGMVVMESLMHEGSQFRNFEGEADRNHHGDISNPLYSDAHNMGTSLNTGCDNQIGDTAAKKLATILKNAHTYTEMNISQFGAKEKKTRLGYKDKQKKDAFMQMQHVGNALKMHDQIIQYAKELFAGFRDDRELVHNYKGILAACLLEAFEQFSKDGKQMLKQKFDIKQTKVDNGRSSWRDNLHDNAASKFEASSKIAFVENETSQQPVSEWNLENVRSWLTSTSHKLASETSGGDEMEGKLVAFSLKLIEYLQNELNSNNGQAKPRAGAVATPRVKDISKLQIRWQKLESHDGRKSKTAGQLLILKSVKKLVQITSDKESSNIMHKELKSLLAAQNSKKRKATNAEVAEKRLAQMKRKPWLQAKITT